MDIETLLNVFGRSHVFLVHFPLALLPMAVGFEFIGRKATWDERHAVGRLLLIVAASAALLSVLSGWELAADDATAAVPLTQQLHRWMAVAVGLVCCITVALGFSPREQTDKAPKSYRPALVGALLLALLTGHLGSTLVHGEGFLFQDPAVAQASTDALDGAAGGALAGEGPETAPPPLTPEEIERFRLYVLEQSAGR